MARNNPFEKLLWNALKKQTKKSKRSKKGSNGAAIVVVALLVFWCVWQFSNGTKNDGDHSSRPVATSNFERDAPTTNGEANSVADRETVEIERCVDGDTFVVRLADGTQDRVRLIGANTPETVKPNWPIEPFGPEASAFSKKRVAEANGVATLVADGDRRDKYGRRLAFVYLADDEISLNEELVRQGLAKAEPQYRYSREMKNRLLAAEDAARREGLGIHGATVR